VGASATVGGLCHAGERPVRWAAGGGFLDADYFLTIAELAVALAGFGSLAALIGRQPGAESAAVDAGRLRAMLERSLAAMILAVLPVSLGRFELPEHLIWGAPAVLFAVVAPYLHVAPIRRMRRDPSYQPGLGYRLSGWAALVATLGLLLAGLVGLIRLQPAFGLALVIELSVAASMFLRVASSLMSIHKPPAA
jgi:hypothetical protein